MKIYFEEALYSTYNKWLHAIQITNDIPTHRTKLPMAGQYTF